MIMQYDCVYGVMDLVC